MSLIDLLMAMSEKPKKVLPTIKDLGRKEFLAKMLLDIEQASTHDQWTDIEVALALNLVATEPKAALLEMLTNTDGFIETHAYTHRRAAARSLARKMLGSEIQLLAKMQPSGEWSVKFTWPGGEVNCKSAHGFTMPQAITWCVVAALLNEARKDQP